MTNALGVDDVSSKKSEKQDEEPEPVSQCVGEFGRWQLQLTFLLSLFNFPCTWHIFASTFQSPKVDFWCEDFPDNNSHPYVNSDNTTDACRVRLANNTSRPCTRWGFDEREFGNTITSHWSLVCEHEGLASIAEMTFLAGVAVGGLVSGLVSDRFGRKRTLMTSLVLQIALALSMAFVPWFGLYLVLRCFLGFISVGVVFSGFVLCMELVGGKWRTISGVSYLLPVPLSYISIAGIAYLVRGWQNLQLAITLPSLLLLALYWILPESPLWLLALGRKEEVLLIFQEAARINGKLLPQNVDKILQQAIPSKGENEPKAGILDLFRKPNMRKNSLVLYVIWFSVYLVYYGLVLNLGNIGGDIYITTIISGVVELPAIAASIFVLLKMGRRWPFSLSLLGSGVACLLTLAVPEDLQWLTIALAMIGKLLISSSNAIMPVYTAELFPTVVRNLGVGSSNVSAGIALILVPYLWNLAVMSPAVPMALLGVTGALGGLSVLLLPETADRPLVGSLAETEQIPRRLSAVQKQHSEERSAA